MRRRRPVLGIFSGIVFGVCTSLSLALFGVVALDSIVLSIVPVLGLVLGVVLGFRPLGSADAPRATATVPPEMAAEAVSGDAPAAVTTESSGAAPTFSDAYPPPPPPPPAS